VPTGSLVGLVVERCQQRRGALVPAVDPVVFDPAFVVGLRWPGRSRRPLPGAGMAVLGTAFSAEMETWM
jgi:hypothetical protein